MYCMCLMYLLPTINHHDNVDFKTKWRLCYWYCIILLNATEIQFLYKDIHHLARRLVCYISLLDSTSYQYSGSLHTILYICIYFIDSLTL